MLQQVDWRSLEKPLEQALTSTGKDLDMTCSGLLY